MVIMELLIREGTPSGHLHQGIGCGLLMDESLRGAAMEVSSKLRASGRTVDLVLEPKKMKWVFKHAERTGCREARHGHARGVVIGKGQNQGSSDRRRERYRIQGL